MMALAVAKQEDGPGPDWLSLQEAAPLLGLDVGHLRRSCDQTFGPQGLARKLHGRKWYISRAADPRLRDDMDRWKRDHHQLADLRAAGVKPKYLRIAELRRDLVLGFAKFHFKHHSAKPLDVRLLYISAMTAEGKIGPHCPIRKVQARQFYHWQRSYEDDGIRGLTPRYGSGDKDGRAPAIGEEAWAQFRRFKDNGNNVSLRDAWRLTKGLSETEHPDELDWAWPSYNTVRQAYKDRVPLPERIYINEGPHKFRAKALPKIARSLEDTAAGSHLCGDERTLDFMVRVPTDAGTWRRVRPKITAWMDVRSRMMVGWIVSVSANSDTILSSFKMACSEMGTVPDEVTIDNGKDYRSVAGRARRHRKWAEFDPQRINTAFERLEIDVHYAIVEHPWSKSIESRFNTCKDRIDKFVAGYWGGKPDERPWDADGWTKANIESLLTLEEASDQRAPLAGRHPTEHATVRSPTPSGPRRADNPSPQGPGHSPRPPQARNAPRDQHDPRPRACDAGGVRARGAKKGVARA